MKILSIWLLAPKFRFISSKNCHISLIFVLVRHQKRYANWLNLSSFHLISFTDSINNNNFVSIDRLTLTVHAYNCVFVYFVQMISHRIQLWQKCVFCKKYFLKGFSRFSSLQSGTLFGTYPYLGAKYDPRLLLKPKSIS